MENRQILKKSSGIGLLSNKKQSKDDIMFFVVVYIKIIKTTFCSDFMDKNAFREFTKNMNNL